MDSDQLKKMIASTFDGVAQRYDENAFFAISASKLAEMVPPLERMDVLDLSTGTGAVAIEVSKKHARATIEAVDLSAGMLSQAEKKAHREGCRNIAFKQMDAENLSYGEGSFDVVTCGYAMFFYSQMDRVYRSICKLLRPGGILLFSSFTNQAFNPCATFLLDRLEGQYRIEIPKDRMQRLRTEEQVRSLAAASNPKKVEVFRHLIRYPITTSQWWALCNNAGYKGLLDQLTEDQLVQFKQEHLAEVETMVTDGAIELIADSLFTAVHP